MGRSVQALAGASAAFLALTLGSQAASAQSRLDATRVAGGFHLGFSGEFDTDGLGDPDLESTPGVHIRGDFPIHEFFAIGPMFVFGGWQTEPMDAADAGRNKYLDFDVFARGRYAFEAGPNFIDLYVGMPLGFTLDFVSDDLSDTGIDKAGFGWNIGLWFGGHFIFTDEWGLLVELGWFRNWVNHDVDGFGDFEGAVNQGVLNIGAVFIP